MAAGVVGSIGDGVYWGKRTGHRVGSGLAHRGTHGGTRLRLTAVLGYLGIKSGINIGAAHGHSGLSGQGEVLRRLGSLRFGHYTGTVVHNRVICRTTGGYHDGSTGYETVFNLHADTETTTNDRKKQG